MPIPTEQKFIAILYSLILLLVTVQLIRKHRLREQYALVWFGASFTIFVLSVFDGLVNRLAAFLGVTYAPSLVFALGLLYSLAILLAQSVVISSQADGIRDLAQNMGILEWRLRQLETKAGAFVQGDAAETIGERTAS